MNNPRVSIISIFFNREDSVEDSVQSLINQTYSNLEIIIVDDFSTDNTYEKLKKLEGKDSRIKLYKNEINSGFTKTLIHVISELNSKYVAIHGAGDISLSTRIEEQVKYLEDNPSVGVLSTDIINEIESAIIKRNNIEITTKDLLHRNYITHGSVMFKLSDYRKVGGYRSFFTTRQDKDLWYRMSLVTNIHFYPKKLYKLYNQNNSVTKDIQKTPVPLLLSEFAKILIIERIKNGNDLVDIYGEKAALFYNPTKCNKHFYKVIKDNVIMKKYDVTLNYLDLLIKMNVNPFLISIYKILRIIIKGFVLVSKKN